MMSRDWRCLNDSCGHVFHSYDSGNPPCPVCDCMRVDWVPGGGHFNQVAPRMDARLRSIADQHGMTNLNSPSLSRLNRAAPKVDVPAINPELGIKHFGPGFSSPLSAGGPICVPSSAPMNLRGTVRVGPSASPAITSSSVPGPSRNAVTVARSKQRTIS